jgi:hypothetical protein
MEPSSLIEKMVDDRLKVSLEEHRASMLTDMERIVQKISEHSSSNQLSKFSSILTGVPTFKRKSNEEQYKYNTKVSIALEETEQLLDMDKIEDSRRKIAEGKRYFSPGLLHSKFYYDMSMIHDNVLHKFDFLRSRFYIILQV